MVDRMDLQIKTGVDGLLFTPQPVLFLALMILTVRQVRPLKPWLIPLFLTSKLCAA